jgi:hypothetical protein
MGLTAIHIPDRSQRDLIFQVAFVEVDVPGHRPAFGHVALKAMPRFQSIAYLARSMSALHDPNCFKVMPPRAKRLYGVDEVVICSTSRKLPAFSK